MNRLQSYKVEEALKALQAAKRTLDDLASETHFPDDGEIAAVDVEWVMSNRGELGVKIGSQFFWMDCGESLRQVYADDPSEEGVDSWRYIGKREFGHVCRPEGWTPEMTERYEWTPLPVDPNRHTWG